MTCIVSVNKSPYANSESESKEKNKSANLKKQASDVIYIVM